jgi:hypothetical protein
MCITLKDLAARSLALGKGERIDWSATLPTTVVALANYHLYQLFVQPAAGVYSGAALNAQIVTGGTTPSHTSGLLNFLDPTAPEQSYFLHGEAWPYASILGELLFMDLLAYYPGLNMNTPVAQALVGAASVIPSRITSGRGVLMMVDVTTLLGAGASNLVVTYTNRIGTAGRTTPSTAMVPSSPVGRISHQRWFLPLQSGDDGVQSAQTFDLTAGMGAGNAALSLVKPLVSIPIVSNWDSVVGMGIARWFEDPLDITQILTGAAITAVFIPSAAVASASLAGFLKNVRFNPNS